MSLRSVFHPLADRELNDVAEYFENESRGLGAAFLSEVERSVADIAAFPHAGQEVAPSVHRRLMRRFPYAVLYSIRPDHIRILAIMNLRRRPNYWVGRE